jgi:4-amino-4-deoxy-L-arabinose transferase-like glycosyltransferase
MDRPARDTLALAVLAAVAGAVVFGFATELFPHHSSNHDEGVYLQHARLLLGGELWFTTPLTDAFHWWFFVEDGPRLYSKYQPVVPALFAPGVAVGVPRLVLAVVGAGVAGLVGLLARAAYDGPTGVVAAVLVVLSPLFLLTTSVFLPYAPTSLLNLVFAYGYVRAVRSGRRRWAVVAGVGVGLAFFARPYTAVLFALPFVAHACWLLWTGRSDVDRLRRRFTVLLPVAALGLGFVGLTLAYNVVVVGDPLEFPFLAFAPEDGVGFGRREILGYERDYTLALALEANARVLWTFATRFVAAPPLGTVAAAVGLGLVAVRRARGTAAADDPDGGRLPDHTLRLLFVGVLGSVVVGNLAFWGNLNVLAALSDPTDGLIAQFGPFYHYDLLLPLSALGGAGLVWGWRQLRAVAVPRVGRRRGLAVLLGALLVLAPVAGAAQVAALDGPVEENARYTERFENAYEPFADGEPEGVVFVPTPYGEWLGHPFQALYNDAGLDGETVYALDRAPDDDFRVVDEYPDRDLYRYTYRGEWTGAPRGEVVAGLQPLDVRSGTRHGVTFETGVLGRPSTVRVSDGNDAVTFDVTADPEERFAVSWVLEPGRVRVVSQGLDKRGIGVVTFEGTAEVNVAVTYVQAGGATVTYRQEVAVEERGDTVRVIWPPEVEVCRLTTNCGHEGMYVEGGDYLTGVNVTQRVSTQR